MNVEIVGTTKGNGFHQTVHVDGLDSLMKWLKLSDREMRDALQKGLKESAQPVLTAARANARTIADDGTFEKSLSIRAYASGALKLASTDPAARVKEFANLGAKYRSAQTPLARERLQRGAGVGVPLRGNPPRVMYRALDAEIGAVAQRIEEKLAEVLEGANNG